MSEVIAIVAFTIYQAAGMLFILWVRPGQWTETWSAWVNMMLWPLAIVTYPTSKWLYQRKRARIRRKREAKARWAEAWQA